MIATRHRNKVYVRIPCGEVQYGRKSRSLVVWFNRRLFVLWRGAA